MKHNVVKVVLVTQVSKRFSLLLSILFLLFFISNAQELSDSEHKKNLKYQNSIIKANRLLDENNYIASEKLLKKIISNYPDKPTAYYILSKIKLNTDRSKEYQYYAEKAYIRDTTNDEYLNNLISAYQQNNNNKLLKKYLLKALPNHKGLDFKILLALTNISEFDDKETIEQLNEIERQNPDNNQILEVKYQLYSVLQKHDSARNEIVKLIARNPDDINNRIAYINTLKSLKDTTNFLKQLNSLDSLEPSMDNSWMLRVDYLLTKKSVPEITNYIKTVINSNKVDTLKKYQILIALTSQFKNKQIINDSIYNWIIATKFSKNQYRFLSLFYYYQITEEFEKSIFNLREYTKLNSKDISAWSIILQYYYASQNFNKCLSYCDTLEFVSKDKSASYFRILCFYSLKRHKDLIKEFKQSGFDKNATDEMKLFLYNALAYSYYELNDMGNTFKYYDKILKIDSTDITALNNYAYFLSLEKKSLYKAEQMSRKTIELEPNNPTYLDTYAWILFKMNNATDALFYIEEAIKRGGGSHAEIMDHYGDVLYSRGKKESAIEAWKLSESIEHNSVKEQKIRKNE